MGAAGLDQTLDSLAFISQLGIEVIENQELCNRWYPTS